MMESLGNQPSPQRAEDLPAAAEAERSAAVPPKKRYGKPALKRLGLLRSVTGSDLKW